MRHPIFHPQPFRNGRQDLAEKEHVEAVDKQHGAYDCYQQQVAPTYPAIIDKSGDVETVGPI